MPCSINPLELAIYKFFHALCISSWKEKKIILVSLWSEHAQDQAINLIP